MSNKTLWTAFICVVLCSFAVLLFFGSKIYQQKPPLPERVVTTDGVTIFTGQEIRDGQNVWQSLGGQEVGSIWGHGAYVAPDWSADWLHREAIYFLDRFAVIRHGRGYDQLPAEQQASLQVLLQQELRRNTYDVATAELRISPLRAEAIAAVGHHYTGLFMNDPALAELRTAYTIPENSIKDPQRARMLNAFFFWTAWASVTERPGEVVTYTQNWPPEELVGNRPTGDLILWTGFSVILLIAGIGFMSFYYARQEGEDLAGRDLPDQDPLLGLKATPSMKATLKYFWIVTALILVQVAMGIITVHYSVEGNGFYGLSLDKLLPYSVSRTWHVQLAIFWIATSWLATGLYIAPAVSGYEPMYQRLGVNLLFGALLVIVIGSLAGQWFGIMQKMGLVNNFWFGHQGYEYVDLGRFWQIFLFAGLFIWLFLMGRAIWPAFKHAKEQKSLLGMFLISSVAIAAFYGAGLMWGRQTNLAVAEYWRWWVVHLWVEGFFEVFAAVVIAFLFVRLGLLRIKNATTAVLFSTVVFLTGGIIGTFHHLYFSGTPVAIMALGATFSALEVVPLVMMGFQAWHNYRLSQARAWLAKYKWPIYAFIAVAFWNLVGAGIFGFLINPPIALYYMQGLNTTPVHGHTALFGVYGVLGIGLMLFVLRSMTIEREWADPSLMIAFWGINIGLALMVLLSVLPVGLMQTVASVKHGLWYARSAEFLQQPTLQTLRWLRMVGDGIFGIGVLALGYFVLGLRAGWSFKRQR